MLKRQQKVSYCDSVWCPRDLKFINYNQKRWVYTKSPKRTYCLDCGSKGDRHKPSLFKSIWLDIKFMWNEMVK